MSVMGAIINTTDDGERERNLNADMLVMKFETIIEMFGCYLIGTNETALILR